jgi:tellurite resistance protein TehA-like permease
MRLREALFACALATAGAAVVWGVAALHVPSARIVGGILGALYAWVLLADLGGKPKR